MKKTCENCFARGPEIEEEQTFYCYKYECNCNEVAKEKENPSCWEDVPADYYDSHTCDYENGCCKKRKRKPKLLGRCSSRLLR